jgi:hypothetical protein
VSELASEQLNTGELASEQLNTGELASEQLNAERTRGMVGAMTEVKEFLAAHGVGNLAHPGSTLLAHRDHRSSPQIHASANSRQFFATATRTPELSTGAQLSTAKIHFAVSVIPHR